MDFAYSEKINAFRKQLNDFMDQYIYPNEQTYREQITASGDPHHHAARPPAYRRQHAVFQADRH